MHFVCRISTWLLTYYTYVLSVWLLTTYRDAFLESFKILVTSLNLYPFSTRNSYARGLQAFDIFRETFLCIEMILTEMCHRSSSALRTWFHRGNDILKVSHQPTTIYERKNPMKGSAFNGMTSQAARGSRRWFPFHFTRLLLCSSVFIHRTNEPFQFWHLESIESLPPRISVLLLNKNSFIWRKRKWNDGIISYEIGLLPNSVLRQWKQLFLFLLSDKILMIRWNYAKKGTRSC